MRVENTGQVKVDSEFGRWISKYAADPRFTRYVEIGTWNGRGSTCCFYDGFLKRSSSVKLQSYEIAPDRVEYAKQVWDFYDPIEVIHGRILEECPSLEEVLRVHPNINPEWHSDDVKNFATCPYVAMNDPQVILLDGAEYLTWFEFERMINTTAASVYLLDDTQTAKCPKILQFFAEHPEWKRVAGSDTDRNGWAIFEVI
jgi:hypothetical protein